MQLHGIHHLTAITADAQANHRFYTEVLGLRLVKKSVNQDDTTAYHLFYADGEATPGTDLTFFEWPVPPEKRGTRSISRTGMRVAGRASLDYWHQRFAALGVSHGDIAEIDGRLTLDFEDHEGQRFAPIDDGGAGLRKNIDAGFTTLRPRGVAHDAAHAAHDRRRLEPREGDRAPRARVVFELRTFQYFRPADHFRSVRLLQERSAHGPDDRGPTFF